MNCRQCGFPLTENDQFCKNCGAAVMKQGESSQPVYTQNVNNGFNSNPNGESPMWTDSYGPQKEVQKKSDNTKLIVVGIIIVVLVVVIAIIIGMISSFNSGTNKGTSGTNTTGTSTSNGGTSGGVATQTSYYKVNFNGFTLSIPDSLVYEQYDDVLVVGNEEDTWIAQVELFEGSYAQLKNNMDQMQTFLQQQGMTSSKAQLKTLGGVEFITLEVNSEGYNAIFAYAKANSMYTFAFTVANQANNFDYGILSQVAPIVKNATYVGTTTNMERQDVLNANVFSSLAK